MLMMTTVDNINCEHIPYLIEELMKRGSKNVHVVPAITKKGRAEYIFLIDCAREQTEELAEFMAMETGTLGVRILDNEHYSFDYEIRKLEVSFRKDDGEVLWSGPMSFKVIRNKKGEDMSIRAEYEELKSLTEYLRCRGMNISLYEVREMIEQRAIREFREMDPGTGETGAVLNNNILCFSLEGSHYLH